MSSCPYCRDGVTGSFAGRRAAQAVDPSLDLAPHGRIAHPGKDVPCLRPEPPCLGRIAALPVDVPQVAVLAGHAFQATELLIDPKRLPVHLLGPVQIAVIRTYDSFDTAARDFGIGWSYSIVDVEMEIDETRAIEEDVEGNPGRRLLGVVPQLR